MRDVRTALELWGNWARCKVGTEYPSIAAGMQNAIEHRGMLHECTDVQGQQVDAAVSALKSFDELAHELIYKHYVEGKSFNRLGKVIGRPHQYVSKMIQNGEYYIASKLEHMIGQ